MGFVCFENREAASAAKLANLVFYGHQLHVDYFEPKESRQRRQEERHDRHQFDQYKAN